MCPGLVFHVLGFDRVLFICQYALGFPTYSGRGPFRPDAGPEKPGSSEEPRLSLWPLTMLQDIQGYS